MLTVRVGTTKMAIRQKYKGRLLQFILVLVPAVLVITLIMQKYGVPYEDVKDELRRHVIKTSEKPVKSKTPVGSCVTKTDCPQETFSFLVISGAANVVPPKICIQKKVVLGRVLNNAGTGINIVTINGKTGQVLKTGHFDMYGGDVKPLIEFVQSIERGSVVLMASYDEPSSKLTEEARKLIAELGSSSVKSLGFRDNWVFVGAKGASGQSSFEKHLKSNNAVNKYENWPEIIDIEGCIPKFME